MALNQKFQFINNQTFINFEIVILDIFVIRSFQTPSIEHGCFIGSRRLFTPGNQKSLTGYDHYYIFFLSL